MIKIGVFGASGRVGKLLLEDIKATPNMSVSTVYVRNELDFSIDPSILVTADMKSFLSACDVVIDF
ncbi:MAG: 4-hydroxy-tetrahydrodipicolinate reductase, partial [Sulfurimonas sp.]|nr:4-hydroxy-tetrahydrodipicolinate reductase [Sulfurimonas sp.]